MPGVEADVARVRHLGARAHRALPDVEDRRVERPRHVEDDALLLREVELHDLILRSADRLTRCIAAGAEIGGHGRRVAGEEAARARHRERVEARVGRAADRGRRNGRPHQHRELRGLTELVGDDDAIRSRREIALRHALRRRTRRARRDADRAVVHAGPLMATAPDSFIGKRPITSTSLGSVSVSSYAAAGPPGRQPFLMASSCDERSTEIVVLNAIGGAVAQLWFGGGVVGGYVFTRMLASSCVVPATVSTCGPAARFRANSGNAADLRQRSSSLHDSVAKRDHRIAVAHQRRREDPHVTRLRERERVRQLARLHLVAGARYVLDGIDERDGERRVDRNGLRRCTRLVGRLRRRRADIDLHVDRALLAAS